MPHVQEFAEDCAEILTDKFRAGQISRRDMLLGLSALGIAPAVLASSPAKAAPPDITIATSGGESEKAIKDTYIQTYEKQTGGKALTDSIFPNTGRIRAMVESRNVTWDLCDSGVSAMGELGPRGMLEPIDYSIVDKAQVFPEFAYEYGVCNYMSSHLMAWDTQVIKTEPTLADFFDIKKYPGKRMMRKGATAMLEMALMADGVPADKLYPLDRERALKKITSIKDHVLWWSTGTQSIDYLRNREAIIGWMWNTRANVLKAETQGRINYTFRGGFLMPSLWLVPKGSKNVKQAMIAIAAMQDPATQVALLKLLGNGPANPRASAMETPELRAIDNGAPENAAVQAKVDAKWYGQFNAETEKMYLDMIAS
jgi:putative spermidine/putrescine transport system substrate-binding protein